MKLERPTRIILISLLTLLSWFVFFAALRYVLSMGMFGVAALMSLGVGGISGLIQSSLLYFLGLVGSITLLTFITITNIKLLKNKAINQHAYVITIILCLIPAYVVLFFVLGSVRDLMGVQCIGLDGSQVGCILSPILTTTDTISSSPVLAIGGVLSAYGIYMHSARANKQQ